MAKIGIDVDGVLRDFLGKLTEIYEKETDKKAILPVTDNENLINHFPFDGGKAEFDSFVYSEFPLELFGYSRELTKNAILNINLLAEKLKIMGHELIIITKQFGKSKPANLFFLSKTGCQVDKIIFVQSSESKWEHCDILIDDSISVLNAKPKTKTSVKFNQLYNSTTEADFNISDVKELLDDEFLNKILTNDYIPFEEIQK